MKSKTKNFLTAKEANGIRNGSELVRSLAASVTDERKNLTKLIEDAIRRLGRVEARGEDGKPVPTDSLTELAYIEPQTFDNLDGEVPERGYIREVFREEDEVFKVRFETSGAFAPDETAEVTLWDVMNPEAVGRFILKYAGAPKKA